MWRLGYRDVNFESEECSSAVDVYILKNSRRPQLDGYGDVAAAFEFRQRSLKSLALQQLGGIGCAEAEALN